MSSQQGNMNFGSGARPKTGSFAGMNMYNVLDEDDDGATWQVSERKKRWRRSTGGSYGPCQPSGSQFTNDRGVSGNFFSKTEFKRLSTDDKLVKLFEVMTDIGSLYGRVQDVETKVHNLKLTTEAHDQRIKLVEYKSLDLEARSRRSNLIFRGHPENVEDDDCASIIRRFLEEKLSIEKDIYIQRAHRLGNVRRRRAGPGGKTDTRPRPIIVCFRDAQDIDLILQNAYKLKDTQFGIHRDYPKEILNARSSLWPSYKQAKANNPRADVSIGYPAKLLINGRVVADKFPNWREVLRGSRTSEPVVRTTPEQSLNQRQNQTATNVIPPQIIEQSEINQVSSDDDIASMKSVRSSVISRSASPRSRRSSNSDLNGITASNERENKNGQYTTNSNPSNQSKSGPNVCVDGAQGSKTQQPGAAKLSSAENSFTWHSKTFEEEKQRLLANVTNVRETRSRAARSSSETRLTKGSREYAGDTRMPNSQQR